MVKEVTGSGQHGYSHVSVPFLTGQSNIVWLFLNKASLLLFTSEVFFWLICLVFFCTV